MYLAFQAFTGRASDRQRPAPMKSPTLILAAMLATSSGLQFAFAGEMVPQDLIPAQYGAGPGTGAWRDFGPGTGTGTGRGAGSGDIECRTERIPGSGRGPQRVCYRCRTLVIPGSGQGPQRRCEPM